MLSHVLSLKNHHSVWTLVYLFQYLFFAMFLSLCDESRRRVINLVQNLLSNDVESHVLSNTMLIG